MMTIDENEETEKLKEAFSRTLAHDLRARFAQLLAGNMTLELEACTNSKTQLEYFTMVEDTVPEMNAIIASQLDAYHIKTAGFSAAWHDMTSTEGSAR